MFCFDNFLSKILSLTRRNDKMELTIKKIKRIWGYHSSFINFECTTVGNVSVYQMNNHEFTEVRCTSYSRYCNLFIHLPRIINCGHMLPEAKVRDVYEIDVDNIPSFFIRNECQDSVQFVNIFRECTQYVMLGQNCLNWRHNGMCEFWVYIDGGFITFQIVLV